MCAGSVAAATLTHTCLGLLTDFDTVIAVLIAVVLAFVGGLALLSCACAFDGFLL